MKPLLLTYPILTSILYPPSLLILLLYIHLDSNLKLKSGSKLILNIPEFNTSQVRLDYQTRFFFALPLHYNFYATQEDFHEESNFRNSFNIHKKRNTYNFTLSPTCAWFLNQCMDPWECVSQYLSFFLWGLACVHVNNSVSADCCSILKLG